VSPILGGSAIILGRQKPLLQSRNPLIALKGHRSSSLGRERRRFYEVRDWRLYVCLVTAEMQLAVSCALFAA
jgi:hypothetical protein